MQFPEKGPLTPITIATFCKTTCEQRSGKRDPIFWKVPFYSMTTQGRILHVSFKTSLTLTDGRLCPPYSPDLSPCDFHLFPAFKLPMRGKRYSSVEEAFAVADRFIRDVVLRSPAGGIPALPGRWDRVIDAEGEYFEGM